MAISNGQSALMSKKRGISNTDTSQMVQSMEGFEIDVSSCAIGDNAHAC